MQVQRGMRDKLEKHLAVGRELLVRLEAKGRAVYDYCCFGVDVEGKLSDDRYMVFYNQPASPEGALSWSEAGGAALYRVQLERLPATIDKLVFTVSIDGVGTMGELGSFDLLLEQDGVEKLRLALKGADFDREKAVIAAEIYRKDGWRVNFVARGFDGGLAALLTHYGGELVADEREPEPSAVSQAAPQPVPKAPEPIVQKAEKISLKKGQKVSLSKKQGQGPIVVENGWTAKNKDYDLKALVRYRDGRLIYLGAANDDEVLSTPEGAVKHGGDVKRAGEMERIEIRWHPDIASVALSSYSALENGTGSFREYGVFVRITNGKQVVEIPAADTSSKWNSYTLCFGEILFGQQQDDLEVSALEMYSAPDSESRIGYEGSTVKMDIGPAGKTKGGFWSNLF